MSPSLLLCANRWSIQGRDPNELNRCAHPMLKDEAGVIAFVVTEAEADPITALPRSSRLICGHDRGSALLLELDLQLASDERGVITHSHNPPALKSRWGRRKLKPRGRKTLPARKTAAAFRP